ncbi:hypothetical protein [Methanobrevibacter sp.]|uniref:hypothetical protein n=1 Tax=Methanobrevibacter sp. TaxID=66852 RepID=UPI00386B773C
MDDIMLKKEYLLILLFFSIFILAISSVSANELNASDEIAIGEQNEVSVDSDVGTFTDLAKLFKNNDEVKLTCDYSYNPKTDWKLDDDYTLGIQIDDNVEVDGNNHVIYGNGARVFYVDLSGSLVIKNVTFINNNQNSFKFTCAGTIYSDGKLVLVNCNFINSHVISEGGAISSVGSLHVYNCTFINCSAYEDDVSCGGAILSLIKLVVDHSYFLNNSAESGGAIGTLGEAYVSNSIFESNGNIPSIKSVNGGAIYNDLDCICDISNSFFKNNYATNGGAIYDALAYNCSFSNNTANKGRNMYKCIALNCSGLETEFKTVYPNGFLIKASNMTTTYYSGKLLKVAVNDVFNGEKIRGIGVKLVINQDKEFLRTTDEKGIACFPVSALAKGSYSAKLGLVEDYLNCSSISRKIVIKKASVSIKVSKLTTTYKDGESWKIRLVDSNTKKPLFRAIITLKVFTGKKYKIYTVTTDYDGNAYFKTTKLSPGIHKVILSFSKANYNSKTVKSAVKIIKQKALKFKIEKLTRKEGAFLGIHVKDKSTKKLLNGVKIKLFVYTGSKYKTITLKTKTINKYKGSLIYATNKLSVGKHKVIIRPVSIRYKGFAKTTMTIKKSAKWYNAWTVTS